MKSLIFSFATVFSLASGASEVLRFNYQGIPFLYQTVRDSATLTVSEYRLKIKDSTPLKSECRKFVEELDYLIQGAEEACDEENYLCKRRIKKLKKYISDHHENVPQDGVFSLSLIVNIDEQIQNGAKEALAKKLKLKPKNILLISSAERLQFTSEANLELSTRSWSKRVNMLAGKDEQLESQIEVVNNDNGLGLKVNNFVATCDVLAKHYSVSLDGEIQAENTARPKGMKAEEAWELRKATVEQWALGAKNKLEKAVLAGLNISKTLAKFGLEATKGRVLLAFRWFYDLESEPVHYGSFEEFQQQNFPRVKWQSAIPVQVYEE